jgi:hypothetical protein
LALYRAGAASPFGEIDRFLRNQLLENQFTDLAFMGPMQPQKPRTPKTAYADIDTMVRGTFQCWSTANDLVGNDDIEGCGAGGGVQALALAAGSQAEWGTNVPGGDLRIHLLFNAKIRAGPEPPFTMAAPVAGELWSWLPAQGRVQFRPLQDIARLQLRLPDGADLAGARFKRLHSAATAQDEGRIPALNGHYAVIANLKAGEAIELTFPLREYQTVETAAGVQYRVQWKGSSVLSLKPPGQRKPLYADRARLKQASTPTAPPRYPN